MVLHINDVFPRTITFLVTYQCTAACTQCCFECSPGIKGHIPIDRILKYIDEVHSSFPTLDLIVFSGGECFLLGENLITAVSYAHSKGLSVRCVTNGYWGRLPARTDQWMSRLKKAGLTELNISTGDEHQQYVPFSSIVNAAWSAVENGIRTLVLVETGFGTRFTVEDALKNKRIMELCQRHPNRHLFHIVSNTWIPFHYSNFEDSMFVGYRPKAMSTVEERGCSQIFETIAITPHEKVAACCGLTMEHIPELKLGDLTGNHGDSIKEMFNCQFDDFLKMWIYVDGPKKILRTITEELGWMLQNEIVHPCQACAILHQYPVFKEYLAKRYQKWVSDVILKFSVRVWIQKRLQNKTCKKVPNNKSNILMEILR